MIDVRKLPEELETLTKDLWSLRLQRTQSRIPEDPETDTEGPSSQAFSSQSENESGDASRSLRRSRKDAKVREGTPNLIETLSLCYTGILLLRIPITVADIHDWIGAGELLYYRAAREVPLGMRERLPPRYQFLLEPQDLLPPESLHKSILEVAMMLNKEFGMAVPPLNTPLVRYRWIQRLALPLEIFAGTQRLAKLLKIDQSSFIAAKSNRNVLLRYPEVQLMALVLVATKLLFPMDNIERKPFKPSDLYTLSLDWKVWAKLHESGTSSPDEQLDLGFQEAFRFDESDCMAASDQKLDAYLDWYENNIASEDVRDTGRTGQEIEFRKTLFQMFPLQPRQRRQVPDDMENPSMDRLRRGQRSMFNERTTQATESKNVKRIGSSYPHFKEAKDLSGPIKVLFEKAAGLAGLELESMVQAVLLTERKVQKFEEALRKTAKASRAG